MLEILGSLAVGAVSGLIVGLLMREKWSENRIRRLQDANDDLENENLALRNRLAGRAGMDAKKEKAERMQAIMIEFATAMKEPNANMAEVGKALASKYPDIAMDLLKKGLKF